MPVFYRGPRAVVTHQFVEVAGDFRHRFLVAEMTNVHIILSEPGKGDGSRRLIGISALVGAVLVAPLAVVVPILSIILASSALVLGAGFCLWPRAGRRWQLRARYRGEMVEIFTSRDEREFAGFCRALVRSLEARDR